MSEEEYEIAGLHEQLLEEEAGKGRLAQKIALLTAILASIAAVLSYQSGAKQNEALFLKNQSILLQAQASDAWAYYQSKSTKVHLDRLALVLVTDPARKAEFQADLLKEEAQKQEQQKKAESLQAQARQLNLESEQLLRPHEKMALAMTLIQIAVALASITALTGRRWLLGLSLLAAFGGLGVAVSAFC